MCNQQRPSFNTTTYEINMRVLYDAYANNSFHQASFFHEYYHLLQARTTACGIIRFLNNIERVILFYNAISNRSEVRVPLSQWAQSVPSDQALQAYLGQRSRFSLEAHAADGEYASFVDEDREEFTIHRMDLAVAQHFDREGELGRHHIIREVNGQLRGIPILGKALYESQAEVCSCFFMGEDSELVTSYGGEQEVDTCFYNSIPELVRRRLPKWPLHQTTFFLTDSGLMSSCSDLAFCNALAFLESYDSDIPYDEESWNVLAREFRESCPLMNRSLERVEEAIHENIEELESYDHNLIQLFGARLENCLEMLELRRSHPMFFFPWVPRSIDFIQERFFSIIPVVQATFVDTTRSMSDGQVSQTDLDLQISMQCFSYLLRYFDSNAPGPCVFQDCEGLCSAEKTYECWRAPWERGEIEEGILCPMSFIGRSLQMEGMELRDIG